MCQIQLDLMTSLREAFSRENMMIKLDKSKWSSEELKQFLLDTVKGKIQEEGLETSEDDLFDPNSYFLAVNYCYRYDSVELKEGDRVALLPGCTGG